MAEKLFIAVISNIVGMAFVLVAQFAWKRRSEKTSPLTGLWEDHIVDPTSGVIKKDHIHMRQSGDTVTGSISRIMPVNSNHRKWKFEGRLVGNNIIAIFWPTDKSIPSFGCWFVHLINDHKFDGFYLKLDEELDGKIHKIPMTVKKIK